MPISKNGYEDDTYLPRISGGADSSDVEHMFLVHLEACDKAIEFLLFGGRDGGKLHETLS